MKLRFSEDANLIPFANPLWQARSRDQLFNFENHKKETFSQSLVSMCYMEPYFQNILLDAF